MSGPRVVPILALAFLAGWGTPADGAPVRAPEEPAPGGEVLLPGRLPWGATALPSGQILAPCEDQSLSVVDAQAQVLARWSSGARFSAPVTVGPRGPVTRLAVPQANGRVDVLVWDPESRVLAPVFAAQSSTEAVASAWGPSGTLYLAWKGGRVEAWAPPGTLSWAAETSLGLSALLVDESVGVYAFAPGTVVLLDPRGRRSDQWALAGQPRGLLQSQSGDVYCWTESGLWRKDPEGSAFGLFDPAQDILGVTCDSQDRLVITQPAQIRRLAPSGGTLAVLTLPRRAVTAAVVDHRGRYVVGTTGGLEVWTYDGRLLAVCDPSPPAAPPLLTDQGLAAWSSADWKLHVWTGFQVPPFGWPQPGGTPGRPHAARRPSTVAARAVSWADDAGFLYFFQLAASGRDAPQREALDRLEAEAAQGELLESRPWANLVLLKIARSGLTDLLLDQGQVSNANNWPLNRLRAFTLLARTATVEDRDELVGVLQREFDPAVAARGVLALAHSGWDGDGKLMRLLADLRARMPTQAVLADACIDAARLLWTANGRSADPALFPLVTAVYQGAYPRSVKQKAQALFQDILANP